MYGNSEIRLPNKHAQFYKKIVFLEERDSLICVFVPKTKATLLIVSGFKQDELE